MKRFVHSLVFLLAICPAWATGFEDIEKKAEALSKEPFKSLSKDVPEEAAKMSYATYQAIRFNKAKAIWADIKSTFRLEMFYRAFLFPERVRVHVIDAKGVSTEVPFSPEMFGLDPSEPGKLPVVPSDYGFAGLKVFRDYKKPRSWEEMIIFQGASYFRIPAPENYFGLSARGIAINSASQKAPEEFPAFIDFWVVQPRPGQNDITIFALMDGPTVTGAYEFVVKPEAKSTIADVRASLYFRASPDLVGYAPLTSMFWFGKNNYRKFSDYRPEVHDSDGMLITEKDGRRLWRPLQTVTRHLVDEYVLPKAPAGFGLLQRDRTYASHIDIEANYHRRPSLWVEPVGEGWNNGAVVLWQIPTVDEYHDNIVVYWRPDQTPKAGEKHQLRYRLLSTIEEPPGTPANGQVVATYIQSSYGRKDRFLIMVDFAWGGDKPHPFVGGEYPHMDLRATDAEILNSYVKPNQDGKTWRLYTVVQFPSEKMRSVLRYLLWTDEGWKSEEWTYTFVPQE